MATAVTDSVAGSGHRPQGHQPPRRLPCNRSTADNTTIVGYQASNSIDVKVRKIDVALRRDHGVQTTGGDATRINSVTYSIEDDSQLVKDARAAPSTTPRTGPSSTRSCPDWTLARSLDLRGGRRDSPADTDAPV